MMERLRGIRLPKVPRRTLSIFVLVILLIALNGVLFSQFNSAQAERYSIQEELDYRAMQLAVCQSQRDIDYLQQQLTGLQQQLEQNPPPFPQDLIEVEVEDLVVTSAETAAVQLTSFQASELSTETVGSTEYVAYTYSVSASGQIANLNSFLGLIEEGDFPSLRTENSTILATDEGYDMSLDIIILVQSD